MCYRIKAYSTTSGKVPVRSCINEIKSSSKSLAAKLNVEIDLLEEFGPKRITDSHNYKPIKSVDGLYELRIGNYRFFFSFCQEHLIVFYHGYKKTSSSNKKQDHEISVAENRMREYQNLGKCN